MIATTAAIFAPRPPALGGDGGGIMGKRDLPKFDSVCIEPPSDLSDVPRFSVEELSIMLPRLDRLMEHFGIKPAHETDSDPILPWMLAALLIAKAYVPNFAPKELPAAMRSGNKRKPTGRKLTPKSYTIVLQVETIVVQQGISRLGAFAVVAEQTGRDRKSVEADYYKRLKRMKAKADSAKLYELWKIILAAYPDAAGNIHHEMGELLALPLPQLFVH